MRGKFWLLTPLFAALSPASATTLPSGFMLGARVEEAVDGSAAFGLDALVLLAAPVAGPDAAALPLDVVAGVAAARWGRG